MRRYAKPIIVAESLDDLQGPVSGVITLPRHLEWTGPGTYDLDKPGRVADLYRTVLVEALTTADLNAYLERTTLLRLWHAMWLSADLRNAWEQRFFELRPESYDHAAA